MGVIGFSNVIASDKFAYLPAVGLLMALAYGLTRLWDWRPASAAGRGKPLPAGTVPSPPVLHWLTWPRAAVLGVVVALACAEGIATRRYLVVWQDTISLYRHMLAHAPNSWMIHNNLGRFVELQGNELLEQAAEAVRAGRLAEARADAAQADQCLREARRHFEVAVRLTPDYGDALVNLGKAVFMDAQRDLESARRQAATQPALAPLFQQAARRFEAAVLEANALFHQAVAVSQGKEYAAANNLGAMALRLHNDANGAIRWCRHALAANPYYPEAHLNLALALESRAGPGDLAEAHQHLRIARAIRPSDAEAARVLREFEARHPALRGGERR
jgi:tetratricopeptide (TPR) repeat protein